MSYKIIPLNGKLVVYINGKIHCIAQDMREADTVINNYRKSI